MGCGSSHAVTPANNTLPISSNHQPNKPVGGPNTVPSPPYSEVVNVHLSRPAEDSLANRANSMKSALPPREKLPALPVRALSSWNTQHKRVESGSNTNRDSRTSREHSLLESKTGAITGSKTRLINSDLSTTNKSGPGTSLMGNTKRIKKATVDLDVSHGKTERGFLASTPELGNPPSSVQTVSREAFMIQQMKEGPCQPTSIKVVGMVKPAVRSGPLDTGLSLHSGRVVGSLSNHACNCQFCPQNSKTGNLGIEEEKEESAESHHSVLGDSIRPPEWGPALDKSAEDDMHRAEDNDDSGIHGLLKASLDGLDSIGEISRKKGTSFATSKDEQNKPHKPNLNTSKWGDIGASIREEGFDMLDRSNLENSMFFQDPDEYSQFFGRLKSKFSNRKKLGLNILEGLQAPHKPEAIDQAFRTPEVFSRITQFRRKRRPSESMRDISTNLRVGNDHGVHTKKQKKHIPKQVSLSRSNMGTEELSAKMSSPASLQNSLTMPGREPAEEQAMGKDKPNKKPQKDRFSKNLPSIQENAEPIESATNSPIPRPGLQEGPQKAELSGFVMKKADDVSERNEKSAAVLRLEHQSSHEVSVAVQQKLVLKEVSAVPTQQQGIASPIPVGYKKGEETPENKPRMHSKSKEHAEGALGAHSATNKAKMIQAASTEEVVRQVSIADDLAHQGSLAAHTEIDESARFGGESPANANQQFMPLKGFGQADFPLTLSVGVKSQFKIKLHNPGSIGTGGGGVYQTSNPKGSASPASLNYTLTFQPDDPGNITKRSAGNRSYWTFEGAQKRHESAEFRLPDDSLVSPPQVRSERFPDILVEGLKPTPIPSKMKSLQTPTGTADPSTLPKQES